MMPRVFILDTECIWVDGKIYPKEVSIIDIQNPVKMIHLCIQPPVEFANLTTADRKRNRFVEINIHSIPYDYGTNSLAQLKSCIPKHSVVFIQGKEKANMMDRILYGVNIVLLDAPSISKLPNPYTHIRCPLLTHPTNHCSAIKAYKMLAFYYNHP